MGIFKSSLVWEAANSAVQGENTLNTRYLWSLVLLDEEADPGGNVYEASYD